MLEVLDSRGRVVHRSSSADRTEPPRDEGNVPRWWIRPTRVPSAEAGLHRFVWDLHWPAPAALDFSYPIAAIPHDTPREPRGPWALPGRYTVRLSAGSFHSSQPLVVEMDPRVKTPVEDLRKAHDLAVRLADALTRDTRAAKEVREARASAGKSNPDLDKKLAALESTGRRRQRRGQKAPSLTSMNAELGELLVHVEEVDAAPTTALAQAAEVALRKTEELLSDWSRLKGQVAAGR